MCDSVNKDNRFVITREVDNTFIFTVKANNSTLPIVIDPTDTFKGILRDLRTGAVVLTKDLTVDSAANGRVKLLITEVEASNLQSFRGGYEDRWYLRPTYSLTLECKTVVNGEFLAGIDLVYVK